MTAPNLAPRNENGDSVERAQFEDAWAIAMSGDEGAPGNKPLRSQIDPDRYRGDAVNFAWAWWKRSRDAAMIKLPTEEPGYMYYAPDVLEAIEAAGLKVKA